MKIAILAGGTGSIALQNGLHQLVKERAAETEVKVIVNAYDNGLSTGAVRKVLGGNILGPSDVRKNQTTRFKLVTDQEDYRSALSAFLDERFTVASTEARQHCQDRVKRVHSAMLFKAAKDVHGTEFEHLSAEIEADVKILEGAINAYFDVPIAGKIDYSDFALANIVYAGLAAQNGNSLRAAARIMAGVLNIEDNVLLNDDTSLFLGAITKSGVRITDEGDIVSWNNPTDPIVDVFFTNVKGDETLPVLCDEAKRAMLDSDVIILSSGTQWSSLIPTYASTGFRETMAQYKGKILMVMNRVPDKDAPNQSADDIVNQIIPKYFPEGRVDLIIDETGHELMRGVKTETARNVLKSVNLFDLSDGLSYSAFTTKHEPYQLGRAVVKTIFRDFLQADAFMFDYDDTLVGRGNSFPSASGFNRHALLTLVNSGKNVSICTGNSIKAINLDRSERHYFGAPVRKPITVYADGGVNKYEYNVEARKQDEEARPFTFVECLVPESQFTATGSRSVSAITQALRLAGIPTAKVENRGNVMMSIKPIDPEYRDIVRNLAAHVLKPTGLRVKAAGRTTIEIADANISKEPAVLRVLEEVGAEGTIVFVGDEFDYGNDREVALIAANDKRVKCLRINNPADTALFLSALTQ